MTVLLPHIIDDALPPPARRRIVGKGIKGQSGFLFVFIERPRITHEDGNECVFRFEPDGAVDVAAVAIAVAHEASEVRTTVPLGDANSAFETAKRYLEEYAEL